MQGKLVQEDMTCRVSTFLL